MSRKNKGQMQTDDATEIASTDSKDKKISQLEAIIKRQREKIAQSNAIHFINTHNPDGKRVIGVLENGKVSPTPVYTESQVQEIVADALLQERHRALDIVDTHQGYIRHIVTAVSNLQSITNCIWWVAVASDGQRLKETIRNGQRPELNNHFDDFNEAIEDLPDHYKDDPDLLTEIAEITTIVKDYKRGIRIIKRDNGDFLRSLGEAKLLPIGQRIAGLITRRKPDEGRDLVADVCIAARPIHYIESSRTLYNNLSEKIAQNIAFNSDEKSMYEALVLLRSKDYEKQPELLSTWVSRRQKRLDKQITAHDR